MQRAQVVDPDPFPSFEGGVRQRQTTVIARILISKLKFLYKVVHGEDNLASQAFRSISVNDIESMSIIRQCRFLESAYSSNLTSTVLNTNDLLPANIKKTVLELDRSRILSDAEGHASQSYVKWRTLVLGLNFGTMLLIVDLKALSLP